MIRLISNTILTYTEMVAADELVGASRNRNVQHQLLGQSSIIPEGPSVLQLGGNDVSQLYNSAKIYHTYSQNQKKRSNANNNNACCEYTALNLNCGCPSPSVSGKKCFGAALMRDATHVTKLVRAMHDGVHGELPITLKCRIGLYDNDINNTPFIREAYDAKSNEEEYQKLRNFVETIANDGIVTNFQIHARIAVLGGSFSPADNRRVPPLKYEYVHRLAREFPELNFVLNGGINSLEHVKDELELNVDNNSLAGIMVGRAMVADPWGFAMADELIYGDHVDMHRCANRREVLEAYGRHVDYEELHNDPAQIRRSLVAACAHLFAGEANSKQFRIELDEIAGRPERLERSLKAKVWSSGSSIGSASTGTSTLASALSAPSTPLSSWDDMQAIENTKSWDENEPPLSELIKESAYRHFGDEVLSLSRRDSYDKKVWQEEEAQRRMSKGEPVVSVTSSSSNTKTVSGGVVDGWFNNGLN